MKRLAIVALLLFCSKAHAQVVPSQALPKLDKYGGLINVSTTATGSWYLHKFGNKWLLVDPEGHAWWSLGVMVFDPNLQGVTYYNTILNKYGDNGITWAPANLRRIRAWGFDATDGPTQAAYPNKLNAAWPDGVQPEKIPLLWDVPVVNYSTRYGCVGIGGDDHNKDWIRGMDIVSTLGNVYLGGEDNDPYDQCFTDKLTAYFIDNSNPPVSLPGATANPWVVGFMVSESDSSYSLNKPSHEQGAAMLLSTSPYQTWNDHWTFMYTIDRTVHAKQQLSTFLSTRYSASISALCTAWGQASNCYDSFGTHATNQVDNCGTGNGSNLGPFTCTLSLIPDPDSVWIKVGANVVAGEYTNWVSNITPASCFGGDTGGAIATTIASCTVDHTTKAVSVTFTTGHAPGTGVAVTVDYMHGGWPKSITGSKGLLDEDGSSTWMPQSYANWLSLANMNATMQQDMSDWLKTYATKFFKTIHDLFKADYPNSLLFGINEMDFLDGTTFRKEVLQGLNGNQDAAMMTLSFGDGGDQTRLDLFAQYAGDMPTIDAFYFFQNDDSSQWTLPSSFAGTQNDKGAKYVARMDFMPTATTSMAVANSQPILGTRIWSLHDDTSEASNWGIVSIYDNAYDGFESRSYGCTPAHPESCGACVDSWGYHCGAEYTAARSGFSVGTGTGSQTLFTATIKYLPIQPGTVTISGGGFTTAQLATDSFIRADGGLGANWTTCTSSQALQIVSHVVEGTDNGALNCGYYSAVTWTSYNDQYSEITVGPAISSGFWDDAVVRDSTLTLDGYFCRVTGPLGASATLTLGRYNHANLAGPTTMTISASDQVRAIALGGTIICQLNHSGGGLVTKLSAADSSLASGQAGMAVAPTQGVAANSQITAWNGGSATSVTDCADTGTGTISGANCSGTINNSTGALSVSYGAAPISGAPITAALTSSGWGGYQPSYLEQIVAEHGKILHQLEQTLWSPPVVTNATNQARYKPIAASSFALLGGSGNNNFIPQRAIDGDTATTWQPSAVDPQYLRLDMGSATMGKVILRWGAGYWTNYTIDTSADGISWTNQFTKTGGTGGVETDSFTPVTARYIRINGTARSGTPTLQEFEVYAQ